MAISKTSKRYEFARAGAWADLCDTPFYEEEQVGAFRFYYLVWAGFLKEVVLIALAAAALLSFFGIVLYCIGKGVYQGLLAAAGIEVPPAPLLDLWEGVGASLTAICLALIYGFFQEQLDPILAAIGDRIGKAYRVLIPKLEIVA